MPDALQHQKCFGDTCACDGKDDAASNVCLDVVYALTAVTGWFGGTASES